MANPTPGRPRFYAGTWCLDFANTVEPRGPEPALDLLPDYAALLEWSEEAGILTPALRRRLGREASGTAYDSALELREAVYRIFSAIAAAKTPRSKDLQALQEVYAESQRHATPVLTEGRLEWTWQNPSLAYPAWRIAGDAVELLRSDRLSRVKACQPSCGWLFLDTTKNHSRRWCSMRECGFDAKIHQQAARRKLR